MNKEILEQLPVRTIQVPLTGNMSHTLEALVDGDYDGEYFSQYKWRVGFNGYVARTEYLGVVNGKTKHKLIYLHREVAGAKEGEWVKHINGDKLDCRSANLQIMTPQDSALQRKQPVQSRGRILSGTSSKYRGVHRHAWTHKGTTRYSKTRWTVSCAGHYVGLFKDEIDAAKAYDKAAREIYGDRAVLNFPKEAQL
jgi:hypothetical protein